MKREKKKTPKKGLIMKVLGGGFLTREDFSKIFPFMVYLTVLLMLIITNAYIAESTSRAIKSNATRLRDLRVDYTSIETEYTQKTTNQNVISTINKQNEQNRDKNGLKESFEDSVFVINVPQGKIMKIGK